MDLNIFFGKLAIHQNNYKRFGKPLGYKNISTNSYIIKNNSTK